MHKLLQLAHVILYEPVIDTEVSRANVWCNDSTLYLDQEFFITRIWPWEKYVIMMDTLWHKSTVIDLYYFTSHWCHYLQFEDQNLWYNQPTHNNINMDGHYQPYGHQQNINMQHQVIFLSSLSCLIHLIIVFYHSRLSFIPVFCCFLSINIAQFLLSCNLNCAHAILHLKWIWVIFE